MNVELLSYMPSGELHQLAKDFNFNNEDLRQHLSFTFAVEGISRACSHQLVRHRLASFSQKSQRYVAIKKLEKHVIIPESIKKGMSQPFNTFIESASEIYSKLIDSGVPKEDARFILPNATETSILITIDGRALLHFFGLRCCYRAQWEIKAIADEMLKKIRSVEPELYRKAGPYCFQLDYCPEGRFSCGKMKEVFEQYRNLEQV